MNSIAEKLFEKYEPSFLEMLEELCNSYKLIGYSTFESPMWIQYNGVFDTGDDKNRPFFRSSQCPLGFYLNYIDVQDEDSFKLGIYHELYELFRSSKYKYIRENHPTIYSEIRNL